MTMSVHHLILIIIAITIIMTIIIIIMMIIRMIKMMMRTNRFLKTHFTLHGSFNAFYSPFMKKTLIKSPNLRTPP